MKSSEIINEGLWDNIKNAVSRINPNSPASIAARAQKTATGHRTDTINRVYNDWQQYFTSVLQVNPNISPDEIETELKTWLDKRFKDRPSTRTIPITITNKNDVKGIYKYVSDRVHDYFTSAPAPPPPPPPPSPSTRDGATGALKVFDTSPLIFNFEKSFYYKDSTNKWVVSRSIGSTGKPLPDVWQQFFNNQEQKINPTAPPPTPPTPAPAPPPPVPESKKNINTIIVEGGNIFKTADGAAATQRINQVDVEPTITWLERITGLPLVQNMLGSTGKNITSGDLDIAVDPENKNQLLQKLETWTKVNNVDSRQFIRKSGISVHFKTPILGNNDRGYVQTDFMFGDPAWLKFSMQGGEPGSKFKGLHRAILLSSIAKVYGLKWSPTQGLVSRTSNSVVSQDPDQIAVYLLGSDAVGKDLASVESILHKIRQQPNFQELIAQAKETLASENLHLD